MQVLCEVIQAESPEHVLAVLRRCRKQKTKNTSAARVLTASGLPSGVPILAALHAIYAVLQFQRPLYCIVETLRDAQRFEIDNALLRARLGPLSN